MGNWIDMAWVPSYSNIINGARPQWVSNLGTHFMVHLCTPYTGNMPTFISHGCHRFWVPACMTSHAQFNRHAYWKVASIVPRPSPCLNKRFLSEQGEGLGTTLLEKCIIGFAWDGVAIFHSTPLSMVLASLSVVYMYTTYKQSWVKTDNDCT